MNLENELAQLRKTITSRNKTINGLLESNDSLVKENTEIKEENTELKCQIKLFIDAEQWGKDTAGYKGEYE